MCVDLNRDDMERLVTTLTRDDWPRLARVARQEGLSGEDALDAVQEAFHAFLRLPLRPDLAEAPDELRRFLGVLVRNAARNMRRRHHRAQPHGDLGAMAGVPDDGPEADVALDRAERKLQLVGCMARLSEVQRAVVALRMLEEMSGAEVAEALDIKPGHVAVLLHRAKQDLKRCLSA